MISLLLEVLVTSSPFLLAFLVAPLALWFAEACRDYLAALRRWRLRGRR